MALVKSLSCPWVRIWTKQTQPKTLKGEGRREVSLEKEWNKGFYHVRRMTTYDYSNNKQLGSLPSKNVEESYDGVGECERFDGSSTQPLHYVEERKRKRTDEEYHVRTKNKRTAQKDIHWHYHSVGYKFKY